MRAHLAGLAGASVLLSLLPMGAAGAVTRVEGNGFAAAGLQVVSESCTDPAQSPATTPKLRITPDRSAPLGAGALGWTPTSASYVTGPLVHIDEPSSLTDLRISAIRRSHTLQGQVLARYTAPGDTGEWRGYGLLPTFSAKRWHQFRGAETDLLWRHYTAEGVFDDFHPPATIAALATEKGGDADGAWVGFGFGCDGETFDVDNLKITTQSSMQTIDLDPLGAKASLTTGGGKSKAILIAGARQGLKASLVDSDGQAIRSKVTLWRAPLGSKKFRRVQTFTVGKQGTSTVYLKPVSSGAYKLQYPGTKTRAPSTSKTVALRVHSNVRARLAQGTLVQGNPFTVSGRFWPGRSTRLLLQKYANHQWSTERKLRSAKDGTFRVSMQETRIGTSYWRIYVPKSHDNLDGRSSSMRLVVKARPHSGGGSTPTNPDPPTNDPDNPPPPPTGPQ